MGIAAGAALIAAALGVNPFAASAWVELPGAAAVALSAALGVGLTAVTVLLTRLFVRRYRWARTLHADLRATVRGTDDRWIAALALSGGLAEELLFRGLVQHGIGLVATSVVFGLVHRVRGRGRWAWAAWAAVMGLALGAIVQLTGSLAGAVIAHVAVNAINLRFLRDVDPEPAKRRRPLGGLLAR